MERTERAYPFLRVLAAGVVLAGLAAPFGRVEANAPAPPRGTVVFVTDRPEAGESDGDLDIFVKQLGVDAAAPLVTDPSWDTDPAWAPDGRRVAFSSDRGGDQDIWIVDVVTGAFTHVVAESGVDAQPAWSPDGRRIAFVRDGAEVRVARATGSAVSSRIANGRSPAWSPDGQSLAFVAGSGTSGALKVRNLSSGATSSLGVKGDSPAWSPDGSKLAYQGIDDLGNSHIYTVPSAGGGAVQVTAGEHDDWEPVWSPDGQRLMFSRENIDHDIYIVNLATGAEELLIGREDAYDVAPSWGRYRTTMSLGIVKAATAMSVSGGVSPAPAPQPVVLRLQRKRAGAWQRIQRVETDLTSDGHFTAQMKRAQGDRCRVLASFAGDLTHGPSRIARRFRC